ncbi:MAG TPA: zf-HC2 domain-containing protein [Candidatus Polarisedimenticolia bacterium]|jgi:hypothetical protein|nr:zf-HC2 domain-containing protein [Candidatus Polarisedimenticolia bacterium]
MSPESGFMDEEGHPTLLPWYAAGTLDAWTARRIEEHLAGCAACRLEQEELASMRRTLHRGEGSTHVAVMDLIDFATEATPGGDGGERAAAVRRHLPDCAACREEIAVLHQARRDRAIGTNDEIEKAPGPDEAGIAAASRWRSAFYAAAAVAALLLVPATRGLVGRSEVVMMPREIHPIRLLSPTRGDDGAPVLSGPGPWLIEMVLPFGAPPGEYVVRFGLEGGTDRGARLPAHPDAEGVLSLLLPRLPSAGRYELTLTPVASTGKSYRYAFMRSDPP